MPSNWMLGRSLLKKHLQLHLTRPSQPPHQYLAYGRHFRIISSEPQGARRGLTPISTTSTSSAGLVHPSSTSGSPLRSQFSPSLSAAQRQVTSRQSSTSSTSSYVSPHPGPRNVRSITSSGSPRLSSSLASLSVGGASTAGGPSRLARHSPSVSIPASTGSSPATTGPHVQLSSLVVTQLNILLSTIKDDSDRVKWETQADKIRKLVHDSGMELFTTYFRRLLQSNASTIFPGTPRAPAAGEKPGSYQLLLEEMQKLPRDPQQADKIAQSLDTTEGDLFRDFDLSTFIEHFRLDPVAKILLVQSCRTTSKADLRSKADAILTANIQTFLSTIASPQTADAEQELPPLVLASIVERLIKLPPRNWGEEQRENFFYAIRVRYIQRLGTRVPPPVETAMFLDELLAPTQDNRLAKTIEQTGASATASLEACKDMLGKVETRDISYPQIANALLLMVIAQNGDSFNPGVFVEAVRHHRAGQKIDWTDVVQEFDKEHLRITKKQFLALYNALLPLAREYANFDIQTLWGGQWQYPEAQLSFVVAFLSTTSEELDVMQIPNLRQAFDLTDFATASDSVRAFAEQAIKHPLVSRDATEALFTMIFRSQESYNLAQMLGIPDTVINQNMTIFVCAASAVPKPWAPLQDQALKQLFYPFLLKQHDNHDFVMHSLWQHDKSWIATRMVEFYSTDSMLLSLIFEHALEHGWLELLLTIQGTSFSVDLAMYAHGKGHCNLEEWAQQHVAQYGPPNFARAIMDFLKAKMDDETLVQRERTPPSTPPLTVKTVHALLLIIAEAVQEEGVGQLYRNCLQLYPRLFNYGEDDDRDTIIDANGARSNGLPEDATKDMEERYKDMYGGTTTPDTLVADLNRLKVSAEPADQELFAAMLFGLFEEYNCFGEYPNEALATTAVLFGGLVSYHVLSGIPEQAAIFMILEAVSEYGPEDPMYRFGLQALLHVLPRLKEWPRLVERILQTPSLRGTPAIAAAENAAKELQQEHVELNGDGANGITNGVFDDESVDDSTPPPFNAIQIDPPSRTDYYEDPDEDVSDKVMFVLNNVSKRNFDEKFKEIEGALEEKYTQWFAHYLVEDLAKSQPNFQWLYLQLLENFNRKLLWNEVLRETYISCAKMLNSQSTMDNQHERATMKNLAGWLGQITLARDQPILHRNLSIKDLLIEGYDSQRLLVAVPFACKALFQAAHSKVFKPPNPWISELLGLFSELYHFMDLKLNMKFEIEMLCREFGVDIKKVEPLEIIRGRPTLEQTTAMLQQYIPDGGPDAFGDMALMGLSKRGPNERFSPDAVIQAVPDLGNMLQIPTAVGNITQQQLRNIFVNAAQQAIYEIIAPVVERSVTIASISTSELIQKDFITEGDEEKMISSAHTVVKALSGSLALVTCKEPLRMSITNNIRILASRSLPEQLPEGQILMFVNDNIDTVCSLVESAAENHSLAEIDLQLQSAREDRRLHNEQRPNEPFAIAPVSRWSTLIPEPFRQDQNGLNRQQLALYDDFGRQARIAPTAHATNASQDSNRQLPDVLSDGYLPSLTTPAEAPAMPRQTQQQRIPGMQAGPPQHQINGYMDSGVVAARIIELMQDLQQCSREATEEHIGEIGEGSAIRRIYGELVGLIESTSPAQRDTLATGAGGHCLGVIYADAQKRLEIEVFVRLLMQLCRMSVSAGRQVTMQLATSEDDRIFNAAATASLHNEGLMDLQHIDTQVSKAIRSRREMVLPFLSDILDEMLLGESPVALRTDFVLSYEALGQWLNEDSDLQLGKEIMTKLQTPARHINGMPSPESDTNKNDQQEYLFEEWIRLQRKEVPERSFLAFAQQLHEKHVLSGPEDAMTFFRSCLEMSCAAFDRISNMPYATQDQAYVAIDALAKLVVVMVVFQEAPQNDPHAKKAKSLEAMLRLVILVMNDHHNKQREHWNGRVYFRLFSTLLCELHDHRDQLSPEQEWDMHKAFATALLILQPRYFPGFMYAWLALLSHRLFVPAFLTGPNAQKRAGGWNIFTKLITALFLNLGDLLCVPDSPAVAQDFYRGVLRFFTMLHHDFPDFLIQNHTVLNASVPLQCLQLQNIVNSAVTRAVFNEQPDPFTPGLKINRLEQVRQHPLYQPDYTEFMEDVNILAEVERIAGNRGDESDFDTVLAQIDPADGHINALAVNALVVYVGIQQTNVASVFSSASSGARLLERLLRVCSPKARYHLVSAMTNQIRYVNAMTHYFSTAMQHWFSTGSQEVQEQIMRVLCERLMVPRPHPWGLIVMMLELVKNETNNIWSLPWIKTAPQVESMLLNLAHSQDQRQARSPMGAMM
ncbi:unnamed protein product [Zymoseptoria tritici ST99CH_3D1]|uniref:General negative regulator of transcription subunit 1 n=1 Tax=Zymoseptoria tritici (strain CBS 115943 / IPO323) TaxID=336722 RepID=F9X203_ZYMTI|nr:uncharacterized protein MYCGRDRAFT_90353 [Zymoseptoria tritici IPO323]EGP89689.1 hypothetical protein MYCGRDRAFT_90353 [Zymoseptoria tritici IPO323]SMR46899.1 unnamed protein product [Zymoseptoria tritici ST99CH_3D1]